MGQNGEGYHNRYHNGCQNIDSSHLYRYRITHSQDFHIRKILSISYVLIKAPVTTSICIVILINYTYSIYLEIYRKILMS